MEEEEAHNLYQQFQKTDAAAKQKQVQGFARNSQLTAAFAVLVALLQPSALRRALDLGHHMPYHLA